MVMHARVSSTKIGKCFGTPRLSYPMYCTLIHKTYHSLCTALSFTRLTIPYVLHSDPQLPVTRPAKAPSPISEEPPTYNLKTLFPDGIGVSFVTDLDPTFSVSNVYLPSAPPTLALFMFMDFFCCSHSPLLYVMEKWRCFFDAPSRTGDVRCSHFLRASDMASGYS